MINDLLKLREAFLKTHTAAPVKRTYGIIFAGSLKGGDQHFLDVRGWGYLTGGGHGALNLPEKEAEAAHDNMGDYAVACINAAPVLAQAVRDARKSLVKTAAHLAAAISLIEAGGKAAKKGAASDKMADEMIADYKKALDKAREQIAALDALA